MLLSRVKGPFSHSGTLKVHGKMARYLTNADPAVVILLLLGLFHIIYLLTNAFIQSTLHGLEVYPVI